jgi:hypothetical protein
MPWQLYPQGKSPLYPMDRRLGRPKSQSGCSGEEKNSQPLPGLKPWIIQPISSTRLLSYLDSLVFEEGICKIGNLSDLYLTEYHQDPNENCISQLSIDTKLWI